jgi:hypothetical protein
VDNNYRIHLRDGVLLWGGSGELEGVNDALIKDKALALLSPAAWEAGTRHSLSGDDQQDWDHLWEWSKMLVEAG